MKPINQYIKAKLKELRKILIKISYKYAYDKRNDFHIVEIEPYSAIEDNDKVFNILNDIQTEVYNNYPEYNFVYSEANPYNNMDTVLDEYDSHQKHFVSHTSCIQHFSTIKSQNRVCSTLSQNGRPCIAA